MIDCNLCRVLYDENNFRRTCPHNAMELHIGVWLNGNRGCAHSFEQMEATGEKEELPNTDCKYNLIALGLIISLLREINVPGDVVGVISKGRRDIVIEVH